jgi:hypothetical protein
VRKLFNFATATALFALFMTFSIEIYLAYTGQELYDAHYVSKIAIIKDFAYLIAVGCYLWVLAAMMKDYVNPPLPKNEICETEMGFTVIQRDQEGDEIKRERHTVNICHTIPENMIQETMERWHRYRDQSKGNNTSQSLCDYINMRTPYYAATTKEELIERLKNK